MKTKTVYAFDTNTHRFVHAVTLDEGDMSPLEKDVWLIPGSCLLVAPPAAPAGWHAAAIGGAWVLQENPVVPVDPEAPEPEPPVPPTLEERAEGLRTLVQQYMDATAKTKGYDSILNAITYADEESVPKFWAEGRMFRTWRSLMWAACYAMLASVIAGDIPEPADGNALLALLPHLDLAKCVTDEAELVTAQAAAAEAPTPAP